MMGTEARASVTISQACVLLTALNKVYRALTRKINAVAETNSLTMPMRKSHSEAIILLAVAVASPGTIKAEGTYMMPKAPGIPINRYSSPATLAVFLVEFMSSPQLLVALDFILRVASGVSSTNSN